MTVQYVLIDGLEVTADLLNADTFSLDIQKDESSNVVTLALTSSMVFVGETYQRLIDRFYVNCSDIGLTSLMQLVVDCCNKALVFEIRGENITFNQLECRAELTDYDPGKIILTK